MNNFAQLDERVLRIMQWATLAFSFLTTVALWLVRGKYLPVWVYHEWAFYVTAIGLPALGLLQLFWRPITEKKARGYIIGYHILATIGFMFVTGYDTIFIFMWLLLIMVSDAYLGRKASYASMATFLGGMTVWWRMNAWRVNAGLVFFFLVVLALFICIVAVVVSRIRVISEERGLALEQSREKERLERERLVALINSMGDAVVAINETGQVGLYNAAAASLLDTNVSLTGKQLSDALHLVDAKGRPADLLQLLAAMRGKGNMVRSDLCHQFSNGEKINLYLNVSPIHLGFQKPGERGYILLLRDITKEKSLEQERDEFISVASHELRTPIAIAEGSLSNVIALKARGANPHLIDESIKAAHDQVVLLARMANDLATLSRAERGSGNIDVEKVDVVTLLNKLQASFMPQAQAKGLTLSVRTQDGLPALLSNQVYLQEILQNLLNNAVKYTKRGSVIVTADRDDMRQQLVVSVEDTGIGMSKSDQRHVFEKFWRSEDYRTRETSGTGLGLYLVHRLVQQLGGTVEVESQLDQGSTFTIRIPFAPPASRTSTERRILEGQVAVDATVAGHEAGQA